MLDVGLAGVHVLVTGANGGIGLSLARRIVLDLYQADPNSACVV
jgi:NAD(P)-dependent dehydrogenase (short-subunit alcohol dehydrogenase family)